MGMFIWRYHSCICTMQEPSYLGGNYNEEDYKFLDTKQGMDIGQYFVLDSIWVYLPWQEPSCLGKIVLVII